MLRSRVIDNIQESFQVFQYKNASLKDRLSIMFLATGFFMSSLAIITSLVNEFNLMLLIPSVIVSVTCLALPLISSDLVKSTWVALFLIGIFYYPFIFVNAGGVRGPAPIYFVLLVTYMSFYFEGKKAFYINSSLITYYAAIIILGYINPDFISSRDNDFLRTVDITVAVVSVSIVISVISSATFREYNQEHKKTIKLMKELEVQNDKLTELSILDQLSGVYNRRHFLTTLKSEIIHYKKHRSNFHVMMIDLDDFKNINDTFGHLFGDEVLRKVAQQIKKSTRDYDVIARYGGEEFCVIVSHLNPEDSIVIAERIRLHVERLSLRNDVKMTVSIGVTSYQEDDTIETLINRADKFLYCAKSNGKNCVVTEDC